ncbi:MAG: DUF3850 domain-containing protein [Alicyclobacillus sp.]|nr:DUF3850 domain-containing protein [Alicyclobacillus sp.]
METHEMKIWPQYFEAVVSGDKTFEVRFDDRGFQRGDTLVLREWSPRDQQYTGRECKRLVTYVLHGGMFGLEKGYSIMSIVDEAKVKRVEVLERVAEAAKGWRNSLIDPLDIAPTRKEAMEHHRLQTTVELAKAVEELEAMERGR